MKKLLLTVVAGTLALASFAQEKRIPLFEVYSSSTCPPCRPANVTMKSFLDTKPAEDYVAIKYQMHFPGTGDPYCTSENVSKFNFAGFNSVPSMTINGNDNSQYAGSMGAGMYNNATAEPAQYKLSGVYTFDPSTKTVSMVIKYTPLEDITNPKLHVAIIESETERNAKSNGETKFYNVVKKLVPNTNGTKLTSVDLNEENYVELSYQFNGEYRLPANGQPASYIDNNTEHSVENFENLRVVAWVIDANKKVAQAANLVQGTLSVNKLPSSIQNVSVYPNPAKQDFSVQLNMKDADKVSATLVSVTGQVIKNQDVQLDKGENTIKFDASNIATGTYNLIIFDSKNNSYSTQVVIAN